MPNRFASGKWAIATCDVCGFRYKLKELKSLTIKTRSTNILACPACWTPDQPQLQLGMYPVDDPQALRNPRPDNSYWQSGLTGLQIKTQGEVPNDNVLAFGTPGEGSRVIQWGWNPVGFQNALGLPGLPDYLYMQGSVGQVSIICNGGSIPEVVLATAPDPAIGYVSGSNAYGALDDRAGALILDRFGEQILAG